MELLIGTMLSVRVAKTKQGGVFRSTAEIVSGAIWIAGLYMLTGYGIA